MDLVLTFLGLAIIFMLYLFLQFAVPVILFYLIVNNHHPIWLWATLLIIWFTTNSIMYIIKEKKKHE